MSLTPEERRRIYEEEKARLDAQARLSRERTAPLEAAIESYQRRGFRLLARTETTAQLIKPRQYDPAFGCLGLLTFGVFWLIGLLVYLLQKDQLVYLSLDENGHILVNNRSLEPSRSQTAAGESLATISGRWWGRQALWVKVLIFSIIFIFVARALGFTVPHGW